MNAPVKFARPAPPSVKLRIGAEALSAGSGGVFDHVDPSTGQVQTQIPLAGAKEMDDAVETAHQAFLVWRRWKPEERRDALFRLAALVDQHKDEFAALTALENGTPVNTAHTHIMSFKNWTNYYAGWADKLEGTTSTSFVNDTDFSYSLPEPYGVIGIIITWNGPMVSLGMKVSPALAAGNTVVVKPSEMTPFATDLFARLVLEAGIPPGVVNVVPGGIEAGEALIRHPKVEKVTFTGGPITARKILALCALHLKPAVLELGGKSAKIIFPDGNVEEAVKYCVNMTTARMAGQGCAFPSRLLVHKDVYKEAVERAVATAKQVTVGNPFDDVMMGPVVNEDALHRILGIVERAKGEGGKLAAGGGRLGGDLKDGFFVESTVFTDVDPLSDLAQNEVFGPVLSMIPFSTEDEAIEIANNTQYGLAAFIHTQDIKRAHRVAGELRAGSVMINGGRLLKPNMPFGGHGLSGYGREGGRQGIDEFLRPKTVAVGPF